MIFEKKPSFIQSIYFSVITITTLGYGDFSPKNDTGMVLTSIESILGILIIGFFLNSLWHYYSSIIERKQNEQIDSNLTARNILKLKNYYSYLSSSIETYKMAFAELTTPLKNRGGAEFRVNPEFIFSDLQDLFGMSLLLKNGFNTKVIDIYFEKQDQLVNDFKWLMASFDLSRHERLQKNIINFLTVSVQQDLRNSLTSYPKTQAGEKKLSDILVEFIKANAQCPDLDQHKSSVNTPGILLYQTLKFQINYIIIIEEEFNKIIA